MVVAALVSLLMASSKALSSDNITAHAVSSVATSDVKMVKIFHLSQKRVLRGLLDMLVSEVKFKGLHPK